jgi:predicted Zn-dependent peptidase
MVGMLCITCTVLLLPGAAFAATSLQFESRVSEFTLQNGLHFIILERHNAPVVSCHTHARVGAYVEEEGSTGAPSAAAAAATVTALAAAVAGYK